MWILGLVFSINCLGFLVLSMLVCIEIKVLRCGKFVVLIFEFIYLF